MSKQAKKIDLKQLYKLVYDSGASTKLDLAELTDISVTAISDYVNQLESLGALVARPGESRGGRRPFIYEINQEYSYIVGIDLQPRHFYIFLADLAGSVLISRVVPVVSFAFPQYIAELTQAIKFILRHLSIPSSKVLAIGISISGVTDFANREVERSNNLDWDNAALSAELEKTVEIPVFVDTEVRIYARNEIDLNEQNNISTVLYISDGIGIALVINNKILQGYSNRAGDNRFFGPERERLYQVLRHDPLIREINALPYYSKSIDKAHLTDLNSRFTEHLANPKVREQMDDFTLYIARLMISVAQILNANKVLLTGNVFDYNDFIYEQVKNYIASEQEIYFSPEIKRNKPGGGSLERGIVKFVMEKFFTLEQFTM